MVHLPTTYKSGSLASHLEQIETAIHNRKRLTFEYDAHRGSGWLADGETGGSESSIVGPSMREVDPTAWSIAKVPGCSSDTATKRRVFAASASTESSSSPSRRVPSRLTLTFRRTFPARTRRHFAVAVRARSQSPHQAVCQRRHPWIADEDFGPASRSPGEDLGTSGTIVEFDCGNPDYLISRVLSASGGLRVLAPNHSASASLKPPAPSGFAASAPARGSQ